jgi:hypothetical protein
METREISNTGFYNCRIWVSTMAVFAGDRPVIRSNSQHDLSFLFQSIATQAPRPLIGFRAHIALQSVGFDLLGTLVAPKYWWHTITRHPFVQDAAADKFWGNYIPNMTLGNNYSLGRRLQNKTAPIDFRLWFNFWSRSWPLGGYSDSVLAAIFDIGSPLQCFLWTYTNARDRQKHI